MSITRTALPVAIAATVLIGTEVAAGAPDDDVGGIVCEIAAGSGVMA